MKSFAAFLFAALFPTPGAYGHDASHAKHPAKEVSTGEKSFGRAGDPRKATRTIRVDMSDTMRFEPSSLAIQQGETIRFVVRNGGKTMHEMVIGTPQELKAHAERMRKHPGMAHHEPYMAHVAPAKTETLVWQFTKAGEFQFACLVPGHFEAGMTGTILVQAK